MSDLTENFLVPWCGAKSDIGAGDLADWEEFTDGRDRYLEGHATPGSVGGSSAAHLHTGAYHDHSGILHVHVISTGASTSAINNEHVLKPNVVAGSTHTHTDDSPSALIDYSMENPDTHNSSSGAAQPLTCTVFWIKLKSGKIGDIPDGACCFTDATSAPSGYELCDGGGSPSRPDMDDRFLYGCSATDTDGGAAEGSTTHNHTIGAHNHTAADHDHDDGTIANCSSFGNMGTGSPPNIPATSLHTHTVTNFSTEVLSDTSITVVTVGSSSNDPEYTVLLAIINDSGGESTPVGAILPYIASGALPGSWEDCNGVDYSLNLVGEQIKGTVTGGSVGDTGDGGIGDHTHVDSGHGHTHPAGAHNHTFSFGTCQVSNASSGGRGSAAYFSHTHSSPACANATPTLYDGVAIWQTEDAKYPYRTVRWVRKPTAVTYKRAHAGTIAKTTKEVLAG